MNDKTNPPESTLGKIVERFNGVEMTEVPIPSTAALDDLAPTDKRARRQIEAPSVNTQLSEAESYALGRAPADAAQLAEPLNSLKEDWQLRTNEQGSVCGVGLSIEPGPVTTRLKMTLHALSPVEGTASDDPLTRCTFGAVYSPNPTEEDGVFGKYTPFGTLTYNVRSDIAAHLEVNQAYYIDITKVPS